MPYNKNERIQKIAFFTARLFVWLAIAYLYVSNEGALFKRPFLNNILYGFMVVLSASILISIGRWTLISFYRRRHKLPDSKNNFVIGMNQLAAIFNTVFLVLGIMYALGINPKELLTSITIVAMAIALIFREYITNMISGLFIMFSNQFSIGDLIEVGPHRGEIADINLSNIILKNEDNHIILVPNNMAFSATFVNHAIDHPTKITVNFDLQIAAAINIETLRQTLSNFLLDNFNSELRMDSFELLVKGIDREFIKCKVTVHQTNPNTARALAIKSALLQQVAGVIYSTKE